MSLLLTLLLPLALAAEPRRLTVDEAMALLEQENPALARARAQVQQAEGARVSALSGALPTLAATGSYTRNNKEVELALGDLMEALAMLTGQPLSSDAPDNMVLQPLDSLSGAITLKVPLLAPSSWASAAGAGDSLAASEANLAAQVASVRSAALQAFWSEAAAEALVEASAASVERARSLAESAERALRAGTGTQLSVLQAQTELARREGDLIAARGALSKARLSAGGLLGLDEPVIVTLGEPQGAGTLDPDALVATGLERRPEVDAAEAALQAARAQRTSAWLAYAPSLSAGATAFASNVAYSTGEKTGWKASLDLSWPLVAGGARLGATQRADGALHEAEAGLASARLQVSQQVRGAVDDLRTATERAEAAERQLALAEEGARVAQRSLEAGVTDTATVLDALDRLDRARAAQIEARARLGMAGVALRAATGEW